MLGVLARNSSSHLDPPRVGAGRILFKSYPQPHSKGGATTREGLPLLTLILLETILFESWQRQIPRL